VKLETVIAPPSIGSFKEVYGQRNPNAQDLRVAIVSDAIAARNGVGTYYLDLVEHLSEFVESIHLLSPTVERTNQFDLFALPMPGDRTQKLYVPHPKRFYRKLDELEPNLIVVPSLGAYTYLGMRYAKERNIPLVFVVHTNFDRLLSLYWPNLIARPLQRALRYVESRMIRQAKTVVTLNTDSFEHVDRQDHDKFRVVETPIASDFVRRPIQPLPNTIQRIIFIGRLAQEKGLADFIAAAARLPALQFAIAGDGPGRREVESAAKNHSNIEYLGWLSRTDVLTELDRSEVLVLPSAIETFGTVAFEALARQRYVVLRPQCGITEWPTLQPGLFYIEPGESIDASLQRLIEMPKTSRDSIASQSWQGVEVFNNRAIHRWLDLLTSAAKQPCHSGKPATAA